MYRYWCLFLIVLCSCVVQAETYRLAVFGDSLSAGYRLSPSDTMYSQLEKKLQEQGYDIQVIHASRSGETTRGGLARQNGLLSQKPNGVLLELGINDVFKRYDLAETQKNLETLITRFQNNDIPVLLIGMRAPSQYPNKDAFADMFRKLADKYQLSFYPFYMDGIFENEFEFGRQNRYLLSDKGIGQNVYGGKLAPNILIKELVKVTFPIKKNLNILEKKYRDSYIFR